MPLSIPKQTNVKIVFQACTESVGPQQKLIKGIIDLTLVLQAMLRTFQPERSWIGLGYMFASLLVV